MSHRGRHRLRGRSIPALIALVALLCSGLASAAPAAREIAIDGAIGPAVGDYVIREIQRANDDNTPVIILRLDTPGGLSASMRDIVKAILASHVPVIGYVAPAGARAASAGTYILYATHIAAMAPATNLGAATPIEIGGDDAGSPAASPDKHEHATSPDLSNEATERRKQVNDAVAYIQSLAEQHHRNAKWAATAVRSAASLSADRARHKHVIDLIAASDSALLAAADGRRVTTAGGPVTLHTQGLSIDRLRPGWRTQLLTIVTDPTVAYVLFMIGIVGLWPKHWLPAPLCPARWARSAWSPPCSPFIYCR